MKRKTRLLLALLLCFCIIRGGITAAEAAQTPLTSLTFDADYYYNAYPDLQEIGRAHV